MADGWKRSPRSNSRDVDGPTRRTPGERHPFTNESRGPRLQKVLAAAGIASRRDCEALIEAGEVEVNGILIDALPAWVDPEKDEIRVAGQRLSRREAAVYVMLYKPRGTVTTNSDPQERRRAVDLVNHPSGARLFPVGRLDVDSAGLLLLTNDGELANRLTHPRYGVHKIYEVTVDGRLSDEDVERLERGIFLSDERTTHGKRTGGAARASKLTRVHTERDRTVLLMELGEGRNRQVRRMLLHVGHKVRRLVRVQMGPLKLKDLQPGEWRELTGAELTSLKRAAARHGEEGAPRPRGARRPPRSGDERALEFSQIRKLRGLRQEPKGATEDRSRSPGAKKTKKKSVRGIRRK